MIFLRGPNILFLKPRKVAGTSFEIALSRYAEPEDIITPISGPDEEKRTALGFGGPRNYKKPLPEWRRWDLSQVLRKREVPKKFFNHMSARQVRDGIGKDAFDAACKVSIVRNPYDIVISKFFWRNKTPDIPGDAVGDWLAKNIAGFNKNDEQYFIDGNCIINFFIRYEHLEADIRALEAHKPDLEELWETFSSISAKKSIRPKEATAAAMLSGYPEIVEAIEASNSAVIARFGYELGP